MFARNRVVGAVLALALLGMTFVPAAAASNGPVEDAWQTYEQVRDEALGVYDQVLDEVHEAVCQLLKGGSDSTWGCVQVFYCGSEHCIEGKIWAP
jgi:hypothetical protein